ncbi:DNA translocase FtsK [Peribacillus sp. SI8-4]|uniref:DNA translocase FtsK n=1 Tax=Peribacillus sp. SI8-4 TaxID=3048009 RepID=UPI002553D803|nr:DNA translocase FtsK [Peribacillus sp. SI8-4]
MKKWFQAEEIIEIEEIIIDEPLDEETLRNMDFSKLPKAKKEEIKVYNQTIGKMSEKMSQTVDPDTKILFQYPKGQFKFPLIPDQEQNKRNPRERMKEKREPKQADRAKETRRQARDPEPKRRSFDREPKPKMRNIDREQQAKIVPSNTPFRPTEIPSPIYGFRRPEKKMIASEEIVEYELESKLPVLKKEEFIKDIPVFTPEIPKEVSAEERTEEPAVLIPEQADERGEASEIPAFFRKHPIQPNTVEAESEPVRENIADVQNEVDFGREVAVSIMEQAEDIKPEAAPKADRPAAEQGMDRESESAVLLGDEQPKRPKKHIPFNVMMLKQDRQKNEFINKMKPEKKSVDLESEAHAYKEPIRNGGKGPSHDVPEADPEDGQEISSRPIPFIPGPSNLEAVDEGTIAAREEAVAADNVSSAFLDGASRAPIQEKGNHEEVLTRDEAEAGQDDGREAAVSAETDDDPYYVFPSAGLLTPPTYAVHDDEWLDEQTSLLDETLKNFNVRAKVVNVTQGPAVTRFEVHPEPGVKVNKVTNLMDDIKLSLAAQDMRMEAPIPGKHTIGIEIPNRKSKPVFLREVLESTEFEEHESPLAVALGLDISGQPIITDLRKMPHGLIAGQTGSGKSVCINTMLISLLYKATPQELKLLLIDPKMVELAPYNRIPHLVSPVITDVKAATAALKWAVEEMERRYELFVHAGVRDISRFNDQAEKAGQYANKLPYILVIIDELADLMMMSPADVEEAICRIAQKARACGIHMIVATQRPSVDVITGLIKANIPTRIAFSVSSQVDSRTIIDSGGAEKLLGRGDMLFAENGSSKTVRLQGTFVSDEEIDQVVNHVKLEQQPKYLFEQEDLLKVAEVTEEADELFFEACEFVVNQQAASASSVQRRFRVGYNRAARLIEMMEQQGVVSESRGSRPRDVLITEEELEFLHVN